MTPHLDDLTLQAWLDGELAEEAAAAARRHVDGCTHCAARAAELGEMFRLFSSLPDAPLERDLAPAVMTALPRSSEGGLRLALGLQAAAAAGLLAVFWQLLGGWLAEAAAPLTAQFPLGLAGAPLALQTRLAEFTLGLQQAWEQAQGLAAQPLPWAGASGALAWILALAALLWLLGNGLLLGRQQSQSKRS